MLGEQRVLELMSWLYRQYGCAAVRLAGPAAVMLYARAAQLAAVIHSVHETALVTLSCLMKVLVVVMSVAVGALAVADVAAAAAHAIGCPAD